MFGCPIIQKCDQTREPISPAERLSVTLRYLATRDSHQTSAYKYHLGHSTVNTIIPETCQALWAHPHQRCGRILHKNFGRNGSVHYALGPWMESTYTANALHILVQFTLLSMAGLASC